MKWENCHEYFLTKEFKENNPELNELLDLLSFCIRTSNTTGQKKTANKIISIVNNRDTPRMINEFVGTAKEIGNYLNNLTWSPIKIYCTSVGNEIKVTLIR